MRVIFKKKANPAPAKSGEMFADPDSPDRNLSVDEAAVLRGGANNYRAYVGPPDRYDFMGATQFSLLFQMGLRDHHKVLDFGCGSLRLGRLLIPYLQAGRYCGIDPNAWLVQDGMMRELGGNAQRVKEPRFSHNTDFNCDVFGEKFDFIVAQSIITHTGMDLFEKFLETAKNCLTETGVILFTYLPTDEADAELPVDGWHYPECVKFNLDTITQTVQGAGLTGKKLPWYHSVTVWYCASRDEAQLPADHLLHHLTGAVFRSDQFKDSLTR